MRHCLLGAGEGSRLKAHRKPALVCLALAILSCTACQAASGFLRDPTTTTSLSTTTTTTAATTTTPPTTTTAAPTTTQVPTTAKVVPTTTAKPAPPPRPVFPKKTVAEQGWVPFATVGGVTLHHPSNRVERIAFHESNNDGARELEALPGAVAPSTLESRERGTSPRSAADVVVDPDSKIRSPVTGVVKRSGKYVLYCEYSDFFVVIEPDEHPGWEVKLLHIADLRVAKGTRVTAGQTTIASRPAVLPFESQVDETSATKPAWPHVHIEVVDPTIKDRPSPGGGCD